MKWLWIMTAVTTVVHVMCIVLWLSERRGYIKARERYEKAYRDISGLIGKLEGGKK